jgi:Ca-activated chloride channel homolog
MLFRPLIFVLFVFAGLAVTPAVAGDPGAANLASRDHPMPQGPQPQGTDFNLITAVDVSDSITRHDEWLQYSGLARGVLDPAFLGRIAEGMEQRIGFMAYTWSSGGNFEVIVPWTIIATRADAERVALQFENAPRIDRSGYGSYLPSRFNTPTGGMTDIAEALEAAVTYSLSAPYPARRSVINILSNGVDNNGKNPATIRDNAIRLGITINGVVFGTRQDLPGYFRNNVVGGPGAFLMSVQEPDDLPATLEQKFWQDMIAGLPVAPAG